MAVELKALGNSCNLYCRYCYQNPQKTQNKSNSSTSSYDLDLIKESLSRTKGTFVLFGGEPLLMPLNDLEELFSWGFQKNGKNSIQTNGTLITPQHITLFKKYNVAVGISIDGPQECNDVRWVGSLEKTRAMTAKIEKIISLLCHEGLAPSIITTLHRENASDENLPILKKWFLALDAQGVSKVRLHILDAKSSTVRDKLALSHAENTRVFMFFAKCREEFRNIRFDIFEDMQALLQGKDSNSSCIWNACDPYSTLAVYGLEGDGLLSNCGRVNNEGINFVKAASIGFERQIALMNTEMKNDGCAECRFFILCKGSCPGSSEKGDWRRRSEYCSIWFALFEYFEQVLLSNGYTPLSKDDLSEEVKIELHKKWTAGTTESIESITRRLQSTKASNSNDKEKTNDIFIKKLSSQLIRTSWVSEEAREYWGRTLLGLADTVQQIRIKALLQHKSRAVILQINHGDLESRAKEMDAFGFSILPLQRKIDYLKISFLAEEMTQNQLLVYNCIVCKKNDFETIKAAYENNAHRDIFALLDLPVCCKKEFQEHHNGVIALLDPFNRKHRKPSNKRTQRNLGVVPFFQSIGINLSSHIPCNQDCEATQLIEKELECLGKEIGYTSQIEQINNIRQWPMEWSFLNGAHEFKTPVFKMTLGTCEQGAGFSLKSDGNIWPNKGAKGSSYPFNRRKELLK